jgi:hypothetical protein
MKLLVSNIRKKMKIKKEEMELELKEVKTKIAQDLLKANKLGNEKNCFNGKSNVDLRGSYCDSKFSDSYVNHKDCLTDEFWCEICCQNEFGNLYIKKRYKCNDLCDNFDSKPNKKQEEKNGKWIWAEKHFTK